MKYFLSVLVLMVQEVCLDVLLNKYKGRIKVKDSGAVSKKLEQMLKDGPSKLQVLLKLFSVNFAKTSCQGET